MPWNIAEGPAKLTESRPWEMVFLFSLFGLLSWGVCILSCTCTGSREEFLGILEGRSFPLLCWSPDLQLSPWGLLLLIPKGDMCPAVTKGHLLPSEDNLGPGGTFPPCCQQRRSWLSCSIVRTDWQKLAVLWISRTREGFHVWWCFSYSSSPGLKENLCI